MRYIVAMIILFVFSVPISSASGGGGPFFKQLYTATQKDKPAVELIDQSTKKVEKRICLVNIGKNKVEKIPC